MAPQRENLAQWLLWFIHRAEAVYTKAMHLARKGLLTQDHYWRCLKLPFPSIDQLIFPAKINNGLNAASFQTSMQMSTACSLTSCSHADVKISPGQPHDSPSHTFSFSKGQCFLVFHLIRWDGEKKQKTIVGNKLHGFILALEKNLWFLMKVSCVVSELRDSWTMT